MRALTPILAVILAAPVIALPFSALPRRTMLTAAGGLSSGLTLLSNPTRAVDETKVVVLLDSNGEARQFSARPLPKGFDKGLDLPIKDITDEVLGAPGEEDYPSVWPYQSKDFKRIDESDDASFYDYPKLVYHIDGGAVAALAHYYKSTIKPGSALLDICSSWVSHYPPNFPDTMSTIAGTGMNSLELQANKQLTGGFKQSDLNKSPVLPYSDAMFDVVTCVVSVDYLNKPLEVFKEVSRVLKPGGRFILSQSNRLFYSKAIARWLGLGDLGRLELIGDYFHFSNAGWSRPKVFDISAKGKGARDPMYIVEATKLR